MNAIQVDVSGAIRKLSGAQRRQVPFATAKALTRTAYKAKSALRQDMQRVFDRPTGWTLNSVFVRAATKLTLTAAVGLKSDAAKGTPASRYLRPEIFGGPRHLKRSEKALQRRGLLPPGWWIVPGADAKLDSFGNVPRGTMTAILSALASLPGAPSTSVAVAGRKRRSKLGFAGTLFVALPGNHQRLKPGVYRRTGPRALQQLLSYVRQPLYRKRFDFFGVAEKAVRTAFPREFQQALAEAIASSR